MAGRSGKTAIARLRDALFNDYDGATPERIRNLGQASPAPRPSSLAGHTKPQAADPEAAASVSTDELLDRLERQAAAIARVCRQLRVNQERARTERTPREGAPPHLASDRGAADVERRLAEAIERNRLLEQQVEVAWLQLGALEAELDSKRPRSWRRLFGRRRSTLPPAS